MHLPPCLALDALAAHMLLGPGLAYLQSEHSPYTWLDHWKQGEFHHDIVVRLDQPTRAFPGQILVIATNCNGGIKEALCFSDIPDRWALWHDRCPDNHEFAGPLLPILARTQTNHWFDPCLLLTDDARSELLPSCRRRQRGGGWRPLHEVED
jgi:hypothetical protein